jgi:hypothetical protein
MGICAKTLHILAVSILFLCNNSDVINNGLYDYMKIYPTCFIISYEKSHEIPL